jgi:hypothetical protein
LLSDLRVGANSGLLGRRSRTGTALETDDGEEKGEGGGREEEAEVAMFCSIESKSRRRTRGAQAVSDGSRSEISGSEVEQ